jgi:predicted RNase H-like HicB family nuclease/DNA-binding XRE family transcriptional regulator
MGANKMFYHFKYHKDKKSGFWAECLELDGCVSQAENLQDLEKNLTEALNLYLDELPTSNLVFKFPEPQKKYLRINKNIIKIKPDPNILFAQQLRILRLKHHLSQKQVAEKMGYKNIWAYQKFEKHTVSPTLTTLLKLKNIFPELDLNMLV